MSEEPSTTTLEVAAGSAPRKGVLRPAGREDRRRAVHSKAGCSRCRVRFTSPQGLGWDDDAMAHVACSERRNQELDDVAEIMAFEAQQEAVASAREAGLSVVTSKDMLATPRD
jgi:hypothetical protein